MKLLVGLGNPGRRYENTRHNVGFQTIDYLANQLDIRVDKEKNRALIGEGKLKDEKIVLVKPQTFMNLSGEAVAPLAAWYKVEPEDILVIYDDLALEVGRIRIRGQGSHGGHNGVRSLIAHLKTEKIPRIKIGIGSPPPQWDTADYVLGNFSPAEQKVIQETMEKAAKAVEVTLGQGLAKAMNQFN